MPPSYPVLNAPLRELYICWRFIDNDIWDTIMPSLLIFFTAWAFDGRPVQDLPIAFLKSLAYAALYIYTFCLSNQVSSIPEDVLNKPYRPLPSGLVSVNETYGRIIVYNLIYLLVGYFLQIFWYSLAWVFVTCQLNFWGWSNHWASKNLLGMTLGTFLLFHVQWRIATLAPPANSTENYFFFMSAWAGVALPIQDMRDQVGDKIQGRKTLPLSIGDSCARWALCANFLTVCPALFLSALLTQVSLVQLVSHPVNVFIMAISLLVHWCIAIRVLKYKTPVQDHRTYLLYVFLFCAGIPVINVVHT